MPVNSRGVTPIRSPPGLNARTRCQDSMPGFDACPRIRCLSEFVPRVRPVETLRDDAAPTPGGFDACPTLHVRTSSSSSRLPGGRASGSLRRLDACPTSLSSDFPVRLPFRLPFFAPSKLEVPFGALGARGKRDRRLGVCPSRVETGCLSMSLHPCPSIFRPGCSTPTAPSDDLAGRYPLGVCRPSETDRPCWRASTTRARRGREARR